MFENPSIRLELDVPAQKIISQYLENNEKFKEYINNSIDEAVKELLTTDKFKQRIKKEIEYSFVQAFGNGQISRIIVNYISDNLDEHFKNLLCKKDGCVQDVKE